MVTTVRGIAEKLIYKECVRVVVVIGDDGVMVV